MPRVCDARVIASSEATNWDQIPDPASWAVDEDAAYERVLAQLQSEDDLGSPGGLERDYQQSGVFFVYRVDAFVEDGGTLYQRRRWVDRGKTGLDGLPWRYFRTDQLVAVSGARATLFDDLGAQYGG